jgi:glycosyltransferase involved in cell wall biosynthesis
VNAIWFNQLDFASLCRTSRLELARAFARAGHSLRIVGRYRSIRPRVAGINPRPLLVKQLFPDPLGGLFFQVQVLWMTLGGVFRKADLILVDHFCVLTMLPLNVLAKAGLIRTKFVLDIRSCPVDLTGARYSVSRGRYELAIRCAKLFYDGITVITELYQQDVSSRFGINKERIGVWSSGVAADLFDPAGVDKLCVEGIKSRLGVYDRTVIMYHGVLSAFRGLQDAVKALALLRAEGHDNAALVFVGDGPAIAEIRSLAKEHGLSDVVKLVDSVPHEEVPSWVAACDAGMLPFPRSKWWEMSSPLKLLEYLAMEKPVVLTDLPAHRAVMGDAKCAFYLEDSSPVTVARGIRALAAQKGALAQIGKEGRAIVLAKFTWEKQVSNLLGYVERLGSRGSA